jgi:hypothetical protein
LRKSVKAVLATLAVTAGTTVFAASPAHASFDYSCFGYPSTFRSGTHIVWADWNGDGRPEECFGVGDARRITHAWPNSGGFKVMPNDGRADDVMYARNTSIGHRVAVHTTSSGNFYSYLPPGGTWRGWYRCDSQCSYV